MPLKADCFSEEQLISYSEGKLSADERQGVATHLQNCIWCQATLDWLQENLLGELDSDGEIPRSRVELASPPDAPTSSYQAPPEGFDVSRASETTEPMRRLNGYEIVRVLGRGGYGIVYEAIDKVLQRNVAIKVLKRDFANQAISRRRFIREARAGAAINHPNVVTIHGVDEAGEMPFLIMELVAGESLRERIRRPPKLEIMDVLRISAQVAQGLAAAHAQGIIHRDVKPGNIMLVDSQPRVKITDFGLARVKVENIEFTSRGLTVGTPAYMSPEQVRGEELDPRSDLFALGCVIYAMLAGHSPFHGRTTLDIARRIDGYEPPPLTETHKIVPEFLGSIVQRLLQKDRDERYQSAAEVADVLNRHLSILNQTPTDRLPAALRMQLADSPRPGKRSARVLAWGAAAVLSLAAIGLGWHGWLATPTPSPPAPSLPAPSLPADSPPADSVTKSPNIETPVPALSKLTSITVGPSSDADCATIADAINRAAENCTITVTGPGPYAEAVKVSGPPIRGLKLQARPRAVWRTANGSAHCLSISDATDVSIAGFDFEIYADNSRAVAVAGEIDGLSLVDCEFRHMLPDHKYSLVLVGSRPGKTEEQVRIQGCRFYVAQGSVFGVSVGGSSDAASRVRCEECLFSSPHVHFYVTRGCQRLSLARNVFLGGDNGVNINFKSWSPDCRVEIVNNTFVGTRYWIGFMDSFRGGVFPSAPTNSRVCNNLILGGERVQGGADQWEQVLSAWKFAGNFWEIDDTTKRTANYDERIAVFRDKFDVPVRDAPFDPHFLVPAADSPLWTMGVGGDLPQYVGAKGPESSKP